MQECKEGLSVGNDFVERPFFEQPVLSEHLDKSLVEDGRYPLTPVVTAQQDTQQIGRLLYKLRCNLEYVAQCELLCRVIAHIAGHMLELSTKESIKVSTIQRSNHRVTQIGKYLPKVEV